MMCSNSAFVVLFLSLTAASALDLAEELNANFAANPLESSVPGVLLRNLGIDTLPDLNIYCDTQCRTSASFAHAENLSDPERYKEWADCRWSSTLLNKAFSIAPESGCLNFQTGQIMNDGAFGLIFNYSVVSSTVKCSYSTDVGSRFLYNSGCGCRDSQTDLCRDGKCSNACQNIDSWTGDKNTADSKQVASCHCSASNKQNCYHEGPAFYNGTGRDEMKQMLQQRLDEWPPAPGCRQDSFFHSEIILDGHTLQEQLNQDFAASIPAFFVAKNFSIGGVVMDSQEKMYTHFVNFKGYGQYKGIAIPVVSFNISNPSAPFELLPSRSEVTTLYP